MNESRLIIFMIKCCQDSKLLQRLKIFLKNFEMELDIQNDLHTTSWICKISSFNVATFTTFTFSYQNILNAINNSMTVSVSMQSTYALHLEVLKSSLWRR